MAHQDSPRVPPARDRRRAERVRSSPLRVRLPPTLEGTLIDISELGALVRLPAAQPLDKQVTLHIEGKSKTVVLRVRVVRSTPHRIELPAAVLARAEHHVGFEFCDLSPDAVAELAHVLHEESEEAG